MTYNRTFLFLSFIVVATLHYLLFHLYYRLRIDSTSVEGHTEAPVIKVRFREQIPKKQELPQPQPLHSVNQDRTPVAAQATETVPVVQEQETTAPANRPIVEEESLSHFSEPTISTLQTEQNLSHIAQASVVGNEAENETVFEEQPDESESIPVEEEIAPSPQNEAIKSDYLATVRQIIEAHKRYPEASRRRQEEGTIYMQFTILRDGSIRLARIARPTPYGRLNKAAMQTIIEIGMFPPFPETLNSDSIAVNIPITYRLY